jgi:hypothetical protein
LQGIRDSGAQNWKGREAEVRTIVGISEVYTEPLRLSKGRENLMRLAKEGVQERTPEQAELERLREYLLMWAHSEKSETEVLTTKGVPYLDSVRGVIDSYIESADYDRRLDKWARAILDASIDDLLDLPDGWMMRGALRVKYLHEGMSRKAGVPIRVFRHRKLQHLSLTEVDALADLAELALIPMVKRRGIPL